MREPSQELPPDTGQELGFDLYDLTRAAKNYLPTVSQEYRIALHDLSNQYSLYYGDLNQLMRRPPDDNWGVWRVAQSWHDAVEGFRTLLSETAISLELTADALMLAVQVYSRADKDAADALDGKILREGTPSPHPPK